MNFFASELLSFLKNVVKTAKAQNKYVRYTVGIFSAVALITGLQQIRMRLYRKRHSLANGPIGFPVLGCAIEYLADLKPFMVKLSTYGPCSHFIVLGQDVVFINDYKLAKAIYGDDRLLTRQNVTEKFPRLLEMTAVSNGKEWSEGRKLSFSTMAKLLNKAYIEKLMKKVLEEHTFVAIDKTADNGELWFPAVCCRHVAFSTVYGTITGQSISIDNELFEKLNGLVGKWLNALIMAMSSPQCLEIQISSTTEAYQNAILELFKPFIDEQVKNYDSNLDTWTSLMLHEISRINNQRDGDKTNPDKLNLSEKDIKRVHGEIITLLSAGVETTAFTMEYGVTMLAKYPKYQQMLYDELIKKFENREFQMSKVHECPILRAFVSEVLRDAVPSGGGGPRAALFDYSVDMTKDNITEEYADFIGKKCVIPKDCLIMFNYPHFTNSEKQNFNINNYLKYDEVNKTYKYESHPNFFPFSTGKRNCPGENIAIAELTIYLAQLVLNYQIKSPVKEEELIIEKKAQPIMYLAKKVGVKVERR